MEPIVAILNGMPRHSLLVDLEYEGYDIRGARPLHGFTPSGKPFRVFQATGWADTDRLYGAQLSDIEVRGPVDDRVLDFARTRVIP